MQIDLKTLYEQTTMYCNLINTYKYLLKHNHTIELFEQPNTPICVAVHWDNNKHKIISITYEIKENN